MNKYIAYNDKFHYYKVQHEKCLLINCILIGHSKQQSVTWYH